MFTPSKHGRTGVGLKNRLLNMIFFLYRCCGIFNMKLLFGAIDFIYLNVEKDKMMHREQLTINLIHRLTPPSIGNYHILNIHIVL